MQKQQQQNQPKKKRPSRAQRRRQRKMNQLAKNPDLPMIIGDHITSAKSVRGGLMRVPETSSAYMRTVLDPAHLTEYPCRGIPDDNKDPTRMLRAMNTYGVTANWTLLGTGTNTEATIECVDIWLTDFPACPIIFIGVGADNTYYCKYITQDEIANKIGDNEFRLVGRGMTIENVGPRAQRGGYFTCSRVTDNTAYDGGNDISYWEVNMGSADANVMATFSGDKGVYSTLVPRLQTNMQKFRQLDNNLAVQFRTPSGTKLNGNTIGGSSMPNIPGWNWSRVRFVPVTPFAISRPSTSGGFTIKDPLDWNLRITVFSAIELKADTQTATNAVGRDPAVLNLLFAILEQHSGFYPASYNDLRKVMGAIKRTYKKYKPIIDVAAGYIPYGQNINAALGALLGE